MNLPRILVIDDEFAVDANLKRRLLRDTGSIEDVDGRGSHENQGEATAVMAFCRGQKVDGNSISNSAALILNAVESGLKNEPGWSLVLLDAMFVSGRIENGVALGQQGDADFGETVARMLREKFPGLPLVMLTSKHEKELTRSGIPYLSKKDLKARRLAETLLSHGQVSLEQRRALLRLPENVVAVSEKMLGVFCQAFRCAPTQSNILLTGETGVGKEILAKYIHGVSERRNGPFAAANVAVIAESIIESELFGHVKGAFTGAVDDKEGKFKAADGGTIFLDEISSATPGLQVKLLRVLQERQFEAVGSNKTLTVDIRLISATNRDLREQVARGEFREDLLYRINTVTIPVPALRDRREDIVPIAESFLHLFQEAQKKQGIESSDEGKARLQVHAFPGNVRELRNLVEHLVTQKGSNSVISRADVEDTLRSGHASRATFETPSTKKEEKEEVAAGGTDLSKISLRELAHLLAKVNVPDSVSELQGTWSELEWAYLLLIRRMAGAAISVKGDSTGAINLLRASNDVEGDEKREQLTSQKARQLINGLLGREKNASIGKGETDALIQLWKKEITVTDLPPVELSCGQAKGKAKPKNEHGDPQVGPEEGNA